MKIEEKTLAICLLDLIGSTRFIERTGALKGARLLQQHDKLTRSLLYKFRGREIDRSDGFLLTFESTIDALNFALWYQITIPKQTTLHARIGIHWGHIAEVTQEDRYTLVGAKSIELEGVSKNLTARIMKKKKKEQVLLSKEAYLQVRSRSNPYTPKTTRYACVGIYKFKGIQTPSILYAVGQSIESLQPPPTTSKAKRLGGPKKIKSRMRDRKFKEWFLWVLYRLALIEIIYFSVLAYPCFSREQCRKSWGVDEYFFWFNYLVYFVNFFKGVL